MRNVSRRNLLGLSIQDCYGQDVGQVVDTWPEDGGWELELVIVRLPRFGERRMLPIEQVFSTTDGLRAAFSRRQIEDAPVMNGGRHGADDPYRAKAYWMFEEPGWAGILSAPWRRRSGFSGTEKPSPTSQSPTPSAS
jgi:hypothetical protein